MDKATKSAWNMTAWPAWLKMSSAVLGFLAFDLVLNELFLQSWSAWVMNSGLGTIIVSSILSQFLLVAMIGGLFGRTWIAGWLLSMTISLLASVMVEIHQIRRGIDVGSDYFIVVCAIPLVSLGACLPFIAMRAIAGWSLTLDPDKAKDSEGVRTEDLFCFSIVGASCLAITQLSNDFQREQFVQLGVATMLAVIVSLIMLPTVYITFRQDTWIRRLIGYLLLTGLVMAVCCAVTLKFSVAQAAELLPHQFLGLPAAALTIVLGVYIVWACGYRLTRRKKTQVAELNQVDTNPLDRDEEDSKPEPATTGVRRECRVLTAVVVAAAALGVLGKWNYDRSQLRFLTAIENPAEYFQAKVERVDIYQERIHAVVLSSDATLEDLKRVAARTPDIDILSLAGTQITDEDLDVLSRFRSLKVLDLSRTQVSNACLDRLPITINKLVLADTKTDLLAVVARFPYSLDELDMSGTGVTDEILGQVLAGRRVSKLHLARNPITDQGIEAFFKRGALGAYALNLSDTQVTGATLLDSHCPFSLQLDGTKITDQQLLALVTSPTPWNCRYVSLRRTGITGAVLPTLAARSISLAVGQGAITESDFMSLVGARFERLALNGPEFTGGFLADGGVTIQHLDLSDSKVTDEVLGRVIKAGHSFYHVDLSGTQVTEKYLSQLMCTSVDLTNTPVNPSVLIDLQSQLWQIFVRHERFTPAELLKLRRSRVMTDVRINSDMW